MPLLALAALGLSSPACADVAARFAGSGKYAPTMSIAVADGGRARAEAGTPNQPRERVVLITREGVSYLVTNDASGRFVGRLDDFYAIIEETIRSTMPARARDAMRHLAEASVEIVPGGLETIAGRQGRVYTITAHLPPSLSPAAAQSDDDAEAEPVPALPPVEIVISQDPELTPVGREMARLFDGSTPVIAATLGAMPPAVAQIRELIGRGTMIRFADAIRLRSVSTDALPDSAFVLPGPVLTRAQLRARAPRPPSARDE
jgi:hypothetical protein